MPAVRLRADLPARLSHRGVHQRAPVAAPVTVMDWQTVTAEEIHHLLDRLRVARGECQALLADVDARQRTSRSVVLEAEHARLTQEIEDHTAEIDRVLLELHALIPRQRHGQ